MGLADLIPDWGCSVVEIVATGEEAIRVSEEQRPDVALVDVSLMGNVDGLQAAREITGRMGIPVIFMSGYDDEKTRDAAMAVQPLDYLVKPLDLFRLKELLERI